MSLNRSRVPKRQLKDNDSEIDIYFANVGPGINRKPYRTDESQLFFPDEEAKEAAKET